MNKSWIVNKDALQTHILSSDKQPVRFYTFFRFVKIDDGVGDGERNENNESEGANPIIDAPSTFRYWKDEFEKQRPFEAVNDEPDGSRQTRFETEKLHALLNGDFSALAKQNLAENFLMFWNRFVAPIEKSERDELLNHMGEHNWRFPVSTMISFTPAGLRALGVEDKVLASFPEAFTDGMAARANLLGDTGQSSPEYWDGALGDRAIHGLITWTAPWVAYWPDHVRRQLRKAVRVFNGAQFVRPDGAHTNTGTPSDDSSSDHQITLSMRSYIAEATHELGFEILHAEFGEAPYYTNEDNSVAVVTPRVEHFGFRDGLSQPMILTQDDRSSIESTVEAATNVPPGNGRPLSDGSWAPVAPGELFLGFPGEDGTEIQQPNDIRLRKNGTYLVFRKLEQDVFGFHAFIRNSRQTKDQRKRMAAHMMGRWQDGTPVVESPDRELGYSYTEGELEYGKKKNEEESRINNFRFEEDDPHGRKCPIGAHVRRTNPRDARGGEAARRHRILRRSIAYGGYFIPDDWDENKSAADLYLDREDRGMLFVAINASIENQFEVIQREWLNSGEIFGKAGAGKCPISGVNDGKFDDTFVEGGKIAADTHLPSFVTTKGGDYFFVPSKEMVDELMLSERPIPPHIDIALSHGQGTTVPIPSLFAKERMATYSREILKEGAGPKTVKRVEFASVNRTGQRVKSKVAFVAAHKDVTAILENDKVFTEERIRIASEQIMGHSSILGLPRDDPNAIEWRRKIKAAMHELDRNYAVASPIPDHAGDAPFFDAIKQFTRVKCREIVNRFLPIGRIDLLQDLGYYIPYLVGEEFIGLKGPDWLTPVAISSRFAQFKITDVPSQWLQGHDNVSPEIAPYLTMQAWMRFAFAEVFVNIVRSSSLTLITRQAAQEFLLHLDTAIAQKRLHVDKNPKDLLSVLVASANKQDLKQQKRDLEMARRIVSDLLPPLCINVGNSFARVMEIVLDQRFNLTGILQGFGADSRGEDADEKLDRVIDELLRLNSVPPLILRTVKTPNGQPHELPAGGKVYDGDIVAMMVFAAHRDPRVFPYPDKFIIDDPQKRPPDSYLSFGRGLHECWGAQLAQLLLREMLRAIAEMPHLRRAAGPQGATSFNPPRMAYSLIARFSTSV